MSKIIELVNDGKYTELKKILEAKVAKKVVEKIQCEKEEFIKEARKKKVEGTTPEGASTTKTTGE